LNNSTSVDPEESRKGLSREMWIVLILFAALLLSNASFLLALLLLGPAYTFLMLIGLFLSRLLFLVLLSLLAIYYTRHNPK
jgi:hypothetical protein